MDSTPRRGSILPCLFITVPLVSKTKYRQVQEVQLDNHSIRSSPSNSALLAVGTAWKAGSTVIIGRKFSATTFWLVTFSCFLSDPQLNPQKLILPFLISRRTRRKDVRASKANVIQYVGEVLRYLLAAEPNALDKEHNVDMAYGNGCRPDVWNKFRDRFGVRVISEFFASSEGVSFSCFMIYYA